METADCIAADYKKTNRSGCRVNEIASNFYMLAALRA